MVYILRSLNDVKDKKEFVNESATSRKEDYGLVSQTGEISPSLCKKALLTLTRSDAIMD